MSYSSEQQDAALKLAPAAYDAGFRGQSLIDFIATGLAEGGHPESTNPKSGAAGPWQIMPFWFGTGPGQITEANARQYGPAALFGRGLYDQAGGKFTPWEAFTEGTYKQFQPLAVWSLGQLPADAMGQANVTPDHNPYTQQGGSDVATGGTSGTGADSGSWFDWLRQGLAKGVLTAAALVAIVLGLGIYVFGGVGSFVEQHPAVAKAAAA